MKTLVGCNATSVRPSLCSARARARIDAGQRPYRLPRPSFRYRLVAKAAVRLNSSTAARVRNGRKLVATDQCFAAKLPGYGASMLVGSLSSFTSQLYNALLTLLPRPPASGGTTDAKAPLFAHAPRHGRRSSDSRSRLTAGGAHGQAQPSAESAEPSLSDGMDDQSSYEFQAFLSSVGFLETRYTRMMASLSSIAYRMDRVTPRYLKRMHGLELRHTSLACERVPFQKPADGQLETFSHGDGMTPSAELIGQAQPEVSPISESAHPSPAAFAAANAAANVADEVGRLEGYGTWRPYIARANRRKAPRRPAPPPTPTSPQPLAVEVVPVSGYVAVSVPAGDSDSARSDSAPASAPPEASPRTIVENAIEAAAACAARCDERLLSQPEPSAAADAAPEAPAPLPPSAAHPVKPRRRRAPGAHGFHAYDAELEDIEDGMEGDMVGAALRSIWDEREQALAQAGAESWSFEDMRQRMVAATAVRTVTATATASVRKSEAKRSTGKAQRVHKPDVHDTDGHHCPVHWLVADDPRTHIRYFSLQGSDSLESWKANLAFDPVEFEDPSLGVQVHRGMYEAALAAYSRFVPMVQEHLATSPFARVSFTGHSLGGSIAVILALMLVHRKILRPMQLVPVYTFGAAAMFCEGLHCLACSSHCDLDEYATQDMQDQAVMATMGGLLRKLGVPVDSIRNIILTNDIVPRAFACDYSMFNVAKVLRHLSPFTSHGGLRRDDRSIMYNFVGRIVVLQPAGTIAWVTSDAEANHPLLPPGPGLYELCEPSKRGRRAARPLDALDSLFDHDVTASIDMLDGFMPANRPRRRSAPATSSAGGAVEGYSAAPEHSAAHRRIAYFQSVLGNAGSHAAYRLAHLHDPPADVPPHATLDLFAGESLDLLEYAEAAAASEVERHCAAAAHAPTHAASLHHATLAFFDTPHPLVVLSNQSAYGDHGLISRFHHPDHYTQALGSVLRSNLAPVRMLARSMTTERVIAAMKAGLQKTRPESGTSHQRFAWGLEAAAASRVNKALHLGPQTTLFASAGSLRNFWSHPGAHGPVAASGPADRDASS